MKKANLGYIANARHSMDKSLALSKRISAAVHIALEGIHSKEFLEEFFFPLAAYLVHGRIPKSPTKPPKCLDELRRLDPRGVQIEKAYLSLGNPRSGLINRCCIIDEKDGGRFSRLLIKAFASSIDVHVSETPDLAIDFALRKKCKRSQEISEKTTNLIPVTMLEGLKEKIYCPFPQSAFVFHRFPMVHQECYIYAVAYARVYQKTKIIGYPHGGGYFQNAYPNASHVVEMHQCDIYFCPRAYNTSILTKSFIDFSMPRFLPKFLRSSFRPNVFRYSRKLNSAECILVLPLFYDRTFKTLGISSAELIKKIHEICTALELRKIKMHPQQDSVDGGRLRRILQGFFMLTGDLDDKCTDLVFLGFDHTMIIERAAERKCFRVVSFGSTDVIDESFLSTFQLHSQIGERVSVYKPIEKDLLAFYNYNLLGMVKAVLVFCLFPNMVTARQ